MNGHFPVMGRRPTTAPDLARLFLPDFEDFTFSHSHTDTWHGTTTYRAPGEQLQVLVTVKVMNRD